MVKIKCERCGKSERKRSRHAKFCKACAVIHHKEFMRKYMRKRNNKVKKENNLNEDSIKKIREVNLTTPLENQISSLREQLDYQRGYSDALKWSILQITYKGGDSNGLQRMLE